MNAKNFIAAAAVFAFAGSAFAAEAPEAATTATTATATVSATAGASGVDAPAARGDAKQETADVVKNYRTPLAIQLDQYKN